MSVNQMAAEQANLGGSNAGLESVHTPWLTHKIKSFITENLATHSKEKANTSNQKKSTEGQKERVHTEGGIKGRSVHCAEEIEKMKFHMTDIYNGESRGCLGLRPSLFGETKL